MTKHEQTIEEHVTANLAAAIDQSDDYEFAGDSFAQNTYDSVVEDGYTDAEAADAKDWFCNIAQNLKSEAGVTFAGDQGDDADEFTMPAEPVVTQTYRQPSKPGHAHGVEITLADGVDYAYVTMNGKTYYLDDTTDEGICECN